MKRISCFFAALLLAACSSGLDQKFDGSNEAAFKSTLASMKRASSPEEIKRLDEALLVLAISDVSIGYEGGILRAMHKISRASPEQLGDSLLPLVNGRSGRQVIDAGQKRKKDEATKQLAAVVSELARLKKLSEEKANTQGTLESIQVSDATLRFSSAGTQKISLIAFKVKNAGEAPLTHLYLRGSVAAPGSDKALFSGDINYKITDALAPGATKEFRLPNSSPGKWNAPEIWGKENLLFTIEVVNAESGPGKKLAAAFTHKDAERLLTLEQDKPALETMLQEK